MKKLILIGLVLLCGVFMTGCDLSNSSYLRVHIRANSNSEDDQQVKYLVKDVVVEYLTPKLANCKTKSEVVEVINNNMENVKNLINLTLQSEGFSYGCDIEINKEFFPTRTYGELTLDADYYDAVIVRLGAGDGDNWWCVMYPNLCFKEIENVVYKSKIKEIISGRS